MKWIAAHKVPVLVGLVLVGAVAWYLHKRSGSSSTATAAPGSLSPDYGGVAVSPYNDSGAPQFSFDLGSLLPQGNQPPPGGSAGQPPNGLPGLGPPPGTGSPGGQGGTDPGPIHFPPVPPPRHPIDPGPVWPHYPITSPVVSLPITQPFGPEPVPYVPRGAPAVAF